MAAFLHNNTATELRAILLPKSAPSMPTEVSKYFQVFIARLSGRRRRRRRIRDEARGGGDGQCDATSHAYNARSEAERNARRESHATSRPNRQEEPPAVLVQRTAGVPVGPHERAPLKHGHSLSPLPLARAFGSQAGRSFMTSAV